MISAPHTFTKLLKPALCHLRKLGILVICYIDDCLFIANSVEELSTNVVYTMQFFDSLGLAVNVDKSCLVPSQEVEFLGVCLSSRDMLAILPCRRKEQIKVQGRALLRGDVTLTDLASFIGLAVASDPAVDLAPLRYKYLEIVKNRELRRSFGNYQAKISLDSHAKDLINWWIHNIDSQSRSFHISSPQVELYADACLTG